MTQIIGEIDGPSFSFNFVDLATYINTEPELAGEIIAYMDGLIETAENDTSTPGNANFGNTVIASRLQNIRAFVIPIQNMYKHRTAMNDVTSQ